MHIAAWKRWVMGAMIVLFIIAVPYVYYRHSFSFAKRLRVVSAGKVYRSGCLTADGLRAAIRDLGIRTVVNLQEEAPDPELPKSYFNSSGRRESEVCKEMGARMVFLSVELVERWEVPDKQPSTIPEFLKIMDDASTYPVLIHCRAGLHRTGCLLATYRMEYEGWSWHDALRELKNHGFGEFASTSANDYIVQYVLQYQPRARNETVPAENNPFVNGSLNAAPTHGKLTSRQP